MKSFSIVEKGRDNVFGTQVGEGQWVKIRANGRTINCKIAFDWDKGDNELYIFQPAVCIKANYDWRDRLETRMQDKAEMLEDGEVIEVAIIKQHKGEELSLIGNFQYKVRIKGDYSDAAELIRQ